MQTCTWTPPPGHPLQACVLSIFRARVNGANSETILLKGNVDILFNLGAPLTTTGTGGCFEIDSTRHRWASSPTAAFWARWC